MKRAVITGATGAIGSALVEKLTEACVEVLVLCRKNSIHIANLPQNPLVTVTCCDLDGLKDFAVGSAYGKKYDTFYHFGWAGTTGEARNDRCLQQKNVEYTLDAIDLAKRLGCHTFIGAGSQAEYGRAECKLTSKTPALPENEYGRAKLCAGQTGRAHAHSLGLKFIWVRILSVYGACGQNMVLSSVKKLLDGHAVDFTEGAQVWDFLYNYDAAEAFELLAERGVDGKTYVLGSGEGKRLSEYITDIADCLDARDRIRLGAIPYAEGQVMYLCADISELQRDTGWIPRTGFSEGVKRVIKKLQ